jgi:hypothetical protein
LTTQTHCLNLLRFPQVPPTQESPHLDFKVVYRITNLLLCQLHYVQLRHGAPRYNVYDRREALLLDWLILGYFTLILKG